MTNKVIIRAECYRKIISGSILKLILINNNN